MKNSNSTPRAYGLRFTVLIILFVLFSDAQAQSGRVLGGEVRSAADGQTIEGVSVQTGNKYTLTDKEGRFSMTVTQPKGTLKIYHIGYAAQTVAYDETTTSLDITLQPNEQQIEEVEVVNTGYQQLPKERATGSFVQIDNELLNRRVSPNIQERLDGIVPGIQFDNRSGDESTNVRDINIRGINTLTTGFRGPLVVLDNVPYEGDLSNINPNDVESVTLLKDAAASSIWGARAGNGVIVITTKRSSLGQKLNLSLTANQTLSPVPNLDYYQLMRSTDFVDVELMLYEKDFYKNALTTNPRLSVFSPVVQAMQDASNQLISSSERDAIIASARSHDYRDDVTKYFHRTAINQQYAASISGGGDRMTHLFSAGYDDRKQFIKGMGGERITLRSSNTFKLLANLDLNLDFQYAQNRSENNGGMSYPINPGGGKTTLYPYARLADDNGNALAIPFTYNLNYVDTVGQGKLLDWKYRPLDEMGSSSNTVTNRDLLLTVNATYRMTDYLKLSAMYNYTRQFNEQAYLRDTESFYVRDLINRYTDFSSGSPVYNVPLGAILQSSHGNMSGHRGRAQFSLDKRFAEHHEVNAIAGAEISMLDRYSQSAQVYGYDTDILTFRQVDYTRTYPIYDRLSSNRSIPSFGGFSGGANRTVSFYVNGSYTLLGRYIASFSARRDAMNLFGVKTNDRWNPLWSTGLAYIVSNESFLQKLDWLDVLKLRWTYGHSGNAGGGSGSRPIISFRQNALYTNLPHANITQPPNPSLKWEDVRMINQAIDFSLWNRKLKGTIEVFSKKSTDLIAEDPIDPTTGFVTMRKNVAVINSKGVDLSLGSDYQFFGVRASSNISLSRVKDIVTEYNGIVSATPNYVAGSGQTMKPLKDKVLYPVFSYRFMGLDPENGDPMGLYNGEPSKDYTRLLADSLQNLVYHGSGLPLLYGNFSQQLSWKKLSLAFNITYKFQYFFQKHTISYAGLYNSWGAHSDYYGRWQNPGDERKTSIPSMVYPASPTRDNFYATSSANIERGDHIRLQDIRLGYAISLGSKRKAQRSTSIDVFVTASNIAILWRANKSNLDPDFIGLPRQRGYSLGAKINL